MPIILPEISLLSSILPFCIVLSSNFALQIAFLIASPARQDQPPLSTHARKRRRRSMSPCARNTWEIPRMSCTNRSWMIVFLIFASAPERLLPNWRRKFCTHSDAKSGSLSTHSSQPPKPNWGRPSGRYSHEEDFMRCGKMRSFERCGSLMQWNSSVLYFDDCNMWNQNPGYPFVQALILAILGLNCPQL